MRPKGHYFLCGPGIYAGRLLQVVIFVTEMAVSMTNGVCKGGIVTDLLCFVTFGLVVWGIVTDLFNIVTISFASLIFAGMLPTG